MLLGNTSWRIRRVEGRSGRVLVEDAHGAPPNVPFWRRRGSGAHSGAFRSRRRSAKRNQRSTAQHFADRRFTEPAASGRDRRVAERRMWLDDSGAEQAIEYILQGRAVLGDVPTQDTIIAERFFDEGGGMQLVIHAPFGGRINKAWGLALRKRFCRSFNFELQAAATDNGLNIALAEQHSFPLGGRLPFPERRDRAADSRASRAGLAHLSAHAGAGTPIAPWHCCAFKAARKFRPRFSACVRTICWPRFSRTSPPARKTSKATSRFPTILWSKKS